MRTAPIAVALAGDESAAIDAAIADSLITHGDPRCVLACAAFDAAIAAAITGEVPQSNSSSVGGEASGVDAGRPAATRSVAGMRMVEVARRALATAAARLRTSWAAEPIDVEHVDRAMRDLAADLEAAQIDRPDLYGSELHLHRGAGFVRVAFRLAFWHAVHTPLWRDALVDVASRGGDADTNAAIAGALLGARDGVRAIPPAWIERVLGATQPGPAAWAEAHHPRHLLALIRE
jgi:ADP-ribosylglycohydrolase